jgi:hypothetical protein
MSNHQVICVDPKYVRLFLPYVRTFLCDANAKCGLLYDEEALLADLDTARMLLWVCVCQPYIGFEAAMTTRLMRDGNGLVCQILALGGRNMRSWRHLWPRIEAYAKAEDCYKVRVEGRLGWKRILADYVQTGVILEKRMAL